MGIVSIERLGTDQVAVRFNTVSNWTYAVQGLAGLPAGSPGGWSNLFTVPAKPIDDQAVYVDTVTNRLVVVVNKGDGAGDFLI